VTVLPASVPLFVYPRVMPVPLKTVPQGEALRVVDVSGEWFLVRFDRERFGYVHCANVMLTAMPGHAVTAEIPENPSIPAAPVTTAPPASSRNQATKTSDSTQASNSEHVSGYVEWRRDGYMIVDGERLRWDSTTRVKLRGLASIEAVPLGYEVKAQGTRLADGSLLAREVEAKPSSIGGYELDARRLYGSLEDAYLSHGAMFQVDHQGRQREVGKIVSSGPDVDRSRRIMSRLVPPYVSSDRLRVHVVQTDVWNASAMDNGAVWVYSGLLHDMSDDEVGIVLGHELAHFTHQHGARKMKQAALGQIAVAGANLLLPRIQSPTGHALANYGATLAYHAWQNGYSRREEDQADRVGLRYSYEAGFDVNQAPGLWRRFRDRYGDPDRVTNFFEGDHSRSTERARNAEREIAWNYSRTDVSRRN
jgi:hypothetical protein